MRPAGATGPVCSLQEATRHCESLAGAGERLDLVRARPIVSDLELETTLARHRDRVHAIYLDLLERLGSDA